METRRAVERCFACEAGGGRQRGPYVPTTTGRGRDNKTHRDAHPSLSALNFETHIKRGVATPRPRKRGNAPGGDPYLRKSAFICGCFFVFASIRVYSRFPLREIFGIRIALEPPYLPQSSQNQPLLHIKLEKSGCSFAQ
jgi:hypothetical protein